MLYSAGPLLHTIRFHGDDAETLFYVKSYGSEGYRSSNLKVNPLRAYPHKLKEKCTEGGVHF